MPTIVRSFKSACTRRVNILDGNPGTPLWQSNYWERVIRDQEEINHFRHYICTNPERWSEDPLRDG